MPKKESSNPKSVPTFQAPRSRGKWGWAILCFVVAVLLLFSFIDYRPEQSSEYSTTLTDRNMVGLFGSVVSYYAFTLIGVASWLIPLFLVWTSWILIRKVKRLAVSRLAAMLVCIISACGLAAMPEIRNEGFVQIYHEGAGGVLGTLLYDRLLAEYLGTFGSTVIFLAAYITAWFFVFTRDVGAQVDSFFESYHQWRSNRKERKEERRRLKAEAKEARRNKKRAEAAAPPKEETTEPAKAPGGQGFRLEKTKAPKEDESDPKPEEDAASEETDSEHKRNAQPGVIIVNPEKTRKASALRPASKGDYVFPSLDLLGEGVDASSVGNTEEEHTSNAEVLLRTLREFGVEVSLGEIHIGPVITRYEIYPAPGVRVEKIAGLDKNIALGMRAQSVRILAPVPGKGCVGVEVPNQKPTPVGIREILGMS